MADINLIKLIKNYYQKKYDETYNPRAVSAALYYSKKYGFDCGNKSTYNNEADAFKHTFASALVSCEENYLVSLVGGYYHEWSNNSNNKGEYKMDTHNNGIGRSIAKEIKRDYGDKLPKESELKESVNKGDLIYVDDYVRQDGTHVSGYYRRK